MPDTQVKRTLSGLFRAYGSILFAEHPLAAILFLAATFIFPNVGLAGLLAAVTGIFTAGLIKFGNLESGLHVYNSLLVGLSLGAFYQVDLHLAVLIVIGAVLAVFVTVAMFNVMWRLGRMPVLSLPFVVVALTATLAAHSYGTLSRYLVPLAPRDGLISPMIDQFLTALGSAFFTPHPLAGILLLAGLVMTSRYLALLAVSGFLVGFSTYGFLSGSPHPDLVAWNGFNFILVAMALGGIFTVPGLQSFLLAMMGAGMAALLTAAFETFMLVYGLPVMALPFLVTTMTVLLALTMRPATVGLQLLLDAPALPEKSAERFRLAIARHGEFGSVAVFPPFYGHWDIYQGFDGEHTHKPPWQYALDFYITDEGKSFHADGKSPDDYFCFGMPVLSPVAGFVVKTLDTLPDNQPGQVDLENNWGNHVLIRMENGLYALLAHLKQGSIAVENGAWVRAGQQLAECGSSGRSPQPHLHLHLQWSETLGSATYPFHLTTVLHQTAADSQARFRLFSRPDAGDRVTASRNAPALVTALRLGVGRELSYRVQRDGIVEERTLYVSLGFDGQLRLTADSGASAAFTAQDNLLAFYDRAGPVDPFLDMWLLALGLTPFTEGELVWSDQPDMRLMPLAWYQKAVVALQMPLGGGLQSHYERHWLGNSWQQVGHHVLRLPAGQGMIAKTEVSIEPHLGCRNFRMKSDVMELEAELLQVGQKADAGIPAWRVRTGDHQEE